MLLQQVDEDQRLFTVSQNAGNYSKDDLSCEDVYHEFQDLKREGTEHGSMPNGNRSSFWMVLTENKIRNNFNKFHCHVYGLK